MDVERVIARKMASGVGSRNISASCCLFAPLNRVEYVSL